MWVILCVQSASRCGWPCVLRAFRCGWPCVSLCVLSASFLCNSPKYSGAHLAIPNKNYLLYGLAWPQHSRVNVRHSVYSGKCIYTKSNVFWASFSLGERKRWWPSSIRHIGHKVVTCPGQQSQRQEDADFVLQNSSVDFVLPTGRSLLYERNTFYFDMPAIIFALLFFNNKKCYQIEKSFGVAIKIQRAHSQLFKKLPHLKICNIFTFSWYL